MVYYLKINRKEEYTFPNLQKWLDVISAIPDSEIFIICDDRDLEKAVKNRVHCDRKVVYLESERDDPEVRAIVKGCTDARWENAGYAHMTTFCHARNGGVKKFWNIDADDTFICLPKERMIELLSEAAKTAETEGIQLFSLDMWYTKFLARHWTFGITYTDNTVDWFQIMKEHLDDKGRGNAGHPPNIDGYFTYLYSLADARIESFYAENLRFLHYSNDFFRRPWASSFYHWKDGKLSFPILRDCFGIENLGEMDIPKEVIRLDMGISDEEARESLIENCYASDRWNIEYRKR